VEIFGYLDQRVCKYAENLGYALQLTNILRDVKEDAQRGRIYLPVEDLEYFGYKAEDIARGVVNDNFLKMMNFQYDRALTFYRQAEETLPPLERKAQVASEIMKTIYRELLELIKKQKFNVFDRRIRVNKFKKSQLALFTFMKIMLGK
jgi:phytoene synthase